MGILKKRDFFIFIFLFLVTFLIWFKVLQVGFLSDDYDLLYHTSLSQNFWQYFYTNITGGFSGGSYAPIFNLLFGLEYKIFGFYPLGYHFFSLLAYGLTAFFIYKIIFKITANWQVGLLSGLVFISLANHVETAVWVATQVHLFSTLFFLVGIYFYYTFIINKNLGFYLLALLFLTFSIFTKETAIMFPFVLLLMEIFFNESEWKLKIKTIILRMMPFISFVGIFLWLRYQVVGYTFGYYGQESLSFSLGPKLDMLLQIIVNMFVSFPYRQIWTDWLLNHSILTIIIFILFIGSLYFFKQNRKILLFLLLSFLVMSWPFLNLQYHPSNDGNERYAYLLSIFFVSYLVIYLYNFSLLFKKFGKLLLFLLIIIYATNNLIQLQPKLHNWVLSSQLSNKIIKEIGRYHLFNTDKANYYIFVALPDNISGAEAMRNAVKEAVFINEQITLQGERIPLYLSLNANEVHKQCVAGERQSDSFSLTVINNCQDHIFTGFPTHEWPGMKFKMLNFINYNNTGSGLVIDFLWDDLKTLKKMENFDRLVVAYFDGRYMNFVPINE